MIFSIRIGFKIKYMSYEFYEIHLVNKVYLNIIMYPSLLQCDVTPCFLTSPIDEDGAVGVSMGDRENRANVHFTYNIISLNCRHDFINLYVIFIPISCTQVC